MIWYFRALKKSFVFSGRARRAEYWYFMLFNILVVLAILALLVPFVVIIALLPVSHPLSSPHVILLSILIPPSLYMLVIFLPMLALSVRRIHDINLSGWWILLSFLLPMISEIVLLFFKFNGTTLPDLRLFDWLLQLPSIAIVILAMIKGNEGENRFGPDPKDVDYDYDYEDEEE